MYSMILELGKEAEDRLFVMEQRKLEERQRKEEREHRRKMWYLKRLSILGGAVLILILFVLFVVLTINKSKETKEEEELIAKTPVVFETDLVVDTSYREEIERLEREEEARKALMYSAEDAPSMVDLGADVVSEFAIVVDVDNNTIVSNRLGKTRINPASMTKILTVLVALENIPEEKLDDTFTITSDITYYAYKHDLSAVGFSDDEVVTVRDLLYGTILPSGGDAAYALAIYVAGSQEAFVELMNRKLEELGLSETAHFTNCVGLYDEDHYCTCYDMAMIMHAAIDNEQCKEVLSKHIYTTSSTEQHSNGIEISNWFLRRIEDKPIGGEVVCAKTGYVNQSGNCAASYACDNDGNEYIVVTGNAPGSWKCIYDHVRIYRQFFPEYDSENINRGAENEERSLESDNIDE